MRKLSFYPKLAARSMKSNRRFYLPYILTVIGTAAAFYIMAALPVDDADAFQKWLLEEFEDNDDTVMFAPGEPFYGTPGKGKNEIRIAYVLKQADLERAMDLLAKGIAAYNAR